MIRNNNGYNTDRWNKHFNLSEKTTTCLAVKIFNLNKKDFVVLEDEFKNVANNLIITTDDGTYGNSGFAINYLEKDLNEKNIDAIYACGPLPMLKAVKKLAESKNIFCEISLEQRMACGVGACMGCSVKLTTEAVNYARVCKDGPVFDSKSVEI